MGVISRLLWYAGIASPYRKAFWRFAWPLIKTGDIERVVAVGVVAHHLITFARDAASGRQNASFYSRKLREAPAAHARRFSRNRLLENRLVQTV